MPGGPMLSAGKLNRRVTITRPATNPTQNEYGEVTSSPVTLVTVWARIEPLSARESQLGKGFAATVSHKLTIRYRDDVKPSHRITFGTRSFSVNGIVRPEDNREYVELYCTEVVA